VLDIKSIFIHNGSMLIEKETNMSDIHRELAESRETNGQLIEDNCRLVQQLAESRETNRQLIEDNCRLVQQLADSTALDSAIWQAKLEGGREALLEAAKRFLNEAHRSNTGEKRKAIYLSAANWLSRMAGK